MFRILLFTSTLLIIGCREQKILLQPNAPVVLIVENTPCIGDTICLKQGKLTYVSDLPAIQMYDISQTVDFKLCPISDTLQFKVLGEQIMMRFRVNSLEQWDVPLCAGDTVVCRIEQNYPLFAIRNRNTSYAGINYDRLRRLRFSEGDYTSEVQFHNPTLIYLLSHSDWTQLPSLEKLRESAKKHYVERLNAEKVWLDSLFREKLLGTFEYCYFSKRNKYNRLYTLVDDQNDAMLISELTAYSDSIYAIQIYPFYKRYFDAVVQKLYYGQPRSIAQGIDYIYTEVFDRIQKDTLLQGHLRDAHLYQCFRKIDELCPIVDARKYYEAAVANIRDTAILRNLHHHYDKIYANEIVYTDDLLLQDPIGETGSLREILAANVGKVVFVDFWASWCAPCMSEMPASKKLRDEYRGKEVVFIYLAFNDKEENWKNALDRAELSDLQHVYLVTNPRTSSFAEKLKLKTIPRYLIYDKDGRLVNADAPRPGSKEIRTELNKYLY